MKTVAQSSIEELIGELQGLATASRRVGNHAIGDSVGQKASQLLTEIRQVFAPATPPTEQATDGGVTTERDVRCHVAAVAQGETPHEVACRLLNESDPNNVDKWREVNAVEAIITPLVRELNEAKAERDQARQDLEERCAENDRERAAHLQAYQAVTRERDEARAEAKSANDDFLAAAIKHQSELAELRKDRERLAEIRTLIDAYERDYLNPRQLAFGGILLPSIVKIVRPDALRNQQENRE